MAAMKLSLQNCDREVQRIVLDTNLRRERALQKKKKAAIDKTSHSRSCQEKKLATSYRDQLAYADGAFT
jgi:hypothetical protein